MREDVPPAPMITPLPWAVWLLVLTIAAVELVLLAGAHGLLAMSGSAGWRSQALVLLGVNPALQGWMIETGQAPAQHLVRYLFFGIVHIGPLPALMVVVITAALGKACAERLGSVRVLLILALAQALGGFAFGLVADPAAWLIGGYPMIFALAGSYAAIRLIDATSLRAQFAALSLPAILILARLALAWLGGGLDWVADCASCLAGLGLAWGLRPGLLRRLRRR